MNPRSAPAGPAAPPWPGPPDRPALARRRRAAVAAAVVLLAGSLLSLWLGLLQQRAAERYTQERVDQLVDAVARGIEARFESARIALVDLHGLYAQDIPDESRRYAVDAAAQGLRDALPGMLGVGVAEFETDAASPAQSGTGGRMRVSSFSPPDALAIPLGAAFADDEGQREAIALAWRSGQATLGAPLPSAPGRVVLTLNLPIERSPRLGPPRPGAPSTPRPGLGVVFAPLVLADLLAPLTAQFAGRLDFELLASRPGAPLRPLFTSTGESAEGKPASGFERELQLTTAGIGLRLRARPAADFRAAQHDAGSWRYGAAGLALSLLLAALVWRMGSSRARAVAEAQRLTVELDLLSRVARHTSNAVIITGTDGRIRWVNEGFTGITGYTPEEAHDRKPGEMLQCDETDPETVAKLRLAIQQRSRCRVEILNRAKDGRRYWLDLQVEPLHDGTGTLQGFMAIERDVSDRRLAEDALRRSVALTEALVDALPLPVVVKGIDGRIQRVNAAFEALIGTTAGEAQPRTIADLLDPEDAARHREEDQRVRAEGRAREYEVQLRRTGGDPIATLVRKAPVLDARGRPVALIAVLIDLSRERAAAAAERAAKLAAESASRAKSAFLATVSHELRTPMHGVLGMADVLASSGLDAGQARELDTIRNSAGTLLRLIDEILDFSKVEAGRMELSPAPTSIADLVHELSRSLQPVAAARDVALETELGPGLPAAVLVDRLRLWQILNNLVGNGIKFSAGLPDRRGEVRLSVQRQADGIEFTVEDNGVGIAAEAQSRLFQPFVQADLATAQCHGGTGLGLAIARGLAEGMGGRIELHSEVGLGSRLRCLLPLPAVAAAETAAPADPEVAAPRLRRAAPGGATEPAAPTVAGSVLLVDDDPVGQIVLSRQLQVLGLEAEVCADGRAALAAWRRHRHALVLTDLNMPEMDGFALAASIRAEEGSSPRTRILAVTANVLQEDARRACQAGVDEVVSKPIRLERLEHSLRRHAALAA